MQGLELYAAVRLAVVEESLSHREAGRRFGIDHRTVKKMLSYSAPPGYRRNTPVRRPKLEGSTDIIDAILEDDRAPDVPRKQRHTAHRIFERLPPASSGGCAAPPWSPPCRRSCILSRTWMPTDSARPLLDTALCEARLRSGFQSPRGRAAPHPRSKPPPETVGLRGPLEAITQLIRDAGNRRSNLRGCHQRSHGACPPLTENRPHHLVH